MTDFIISSIESAGYVGIALLMLLENLFPPIPSELIVPFAGYVAARGDLWLPGVIASATAGSVVGALPWYALGVWFSEERLKRMAARYGRWFTITPEEVGSASVWFHRFGPAAVFFGRMVPTIRTVISLPAGMVRMGMPLFLLLTTLGSAIWVTILAMAGLLLEAHYEQVVHIIEPVTWVIVIAIILTYIYRFSTFNRSHG